MLEEYSLKEMQKYIKAKDFKPELAHQYFLKLTEEFGELSKAIRKELPAFDEKNIKGTIAEELYDVLYYIIALANIYDIDLEKTASLKEKINLQKDHYSS